MDNAYEPDEATVAATDGGAVTGSSVNEESKQKRK